MINLLNPDLVLLTLHVDLELSIIFEAWAKPQIFRMKCTINEMREIHLNICWPLHF